VECHVPREELDDEYDHHYYAAGFVKGEEELGASEASAGSIVSARARTVGRALLFL